MQRGTGELWVVGEIAAEAAHELRNALAVIAASAELLRSADAASPGSGSTALQAHVAKIQRNARLAQAVLDALLGLARGEEVHGDPVVVAAAVAEARRDVPARGDPVSYVDDIANGLSVAGSEILLSRMFRVLYDNAIQAGATRIETRARAEEGVVVIEVRDDGPGVPVALRETLFEPLVTTKKEGTGLGLALARRVARVHGGDIALETGEGGACFRITLRGGRARMKSGGEG